MVLWVNKDNKNLLELVLNRGPEVQRLPVILDGQVRHMLKHWVKARVVSIDPLNIRMRIVLDEFIKVDFAGPKAVGVSDTLVSGADQSLGFGDLGRLDDFREGRDILAEDDGMPVGGEAGKLWEP